MAKREPELSTCTFSSDEHVTYRFTLEHRWDHEQPSYLPRKTVVWLLLNPSTANGESLDPTLRKARGFSKALGAGGMIILNVFGFRATRPADMLAAADPVGPDNDTHIDRVLHRDDVMVVICGWGTHGNHRGRAQQLIDRYPDRFSALAINKDGTPKHPLYIPYSATVIPYARSPIQPTPSLLPPPPLVEPPL